MFGIGNSSSKTTANTNSSGFSDINDNAAVTNLQGVKLGKNASLNVTDNGAVSKALEFASDQSSQAYDYTRDLANSTADTVHDAVLAVSESARSETENIFINLQKYALYGLMIWGAVQVFRGQK